MKTLSVRVSASVQIAVVSVTKLGGLQRRSEELFARDELQVTRELSTRTEVVDGEDSIDLLSVIFSQK